MKTKKKNEPPIESLPSPKIAAKDLMFGEWAICPKCRARVRERTCKTCGGMGVVPNRGPQPFVKGVGD